MAIALPHETIPINNIHYYNRVADLYPLFFSDLERSMEEEGEWLAGTLRPERVRTVLDACCGTGRQSIPLAARGYQVIAADASEQMLKHASSNALKIGAALNFVLSGFQDLPGLIDSSFDAVIAMGNGLSNVRQEDLLPCLTSLFQCCAAGAVCLIGIKDFDRIRAERPRLHLHELRQAGQGRKMLFEHWDYADPYLLVTAFLIESNIDGRQDARESVRMESNKACEYMLRRDELVRLALEAGFGGIERVPHPREAVYALRKLAWS